MIHKGFITSPELSGLQAIKAHYLLVNNNLRGFEEFADDVIDFSGLGDFIHLPLKTYSQGMAARLLFAVLTGGSHDCLAMDEGFGAGDNSFYEKAQDRMTRFLSSAGTLLLASHSKSCCDVSVVAVWFLIAVDWCLRVPWKVLWTITTPTVQESTGRLIS